MSKLRPSARIRELRAQFQKENWTALQTQAHHLECNYFLLARLDAIEATLDELTAPNEGWDAYERMKAALEQREAGDDCHNCSATIARDLSCRCLGPGRRPRKKRTNGNGKPQKK